MVGTIRVFVELEVMYVLGVASQATESWITQRVVSRVSLVIPQFHLITRLSRVPLPVPPMVSVQIDCMHFSPDRIKKVLLMWLLVCYKSFIYVFMLY